MRVTSCLLLCVATSILGCDDGKPLLTTSGVGHHYTVVIDGTDMGSWREFTLPKGKKLEEGSDIAFRYETPCGPRDVAMKVERVVKGEHGREVTAKPVGEPPTETLVLVDGRGGPVELQIGSAKIPYAEAGHNHHSEPGPWYGNVLDIGCAKSHDVSIGGVKVGTLLGEAPEHPDAGKPGSQRVIFASPKKDQCFLARYAAVKSTRNGQWAGESGGWADVVVRGVGWLPFDPEVFMKEATDAKKPMALFEVPCP